MKRRFKIYLISVLILILGTSIPVSIFFVQAQKTTSYSINDLNNLIGQKKNSIQKLINEQKRYDKNIEILEKDAISLKNQLAILDNNIAQTELDIRRINLKSEETHLKIIQTNNSIKQKKEKIDKQKNYLAEFIRVMSLNDNVSYITMLVGYDSFSDFFDQAQYTQDIEKQVFNSIKSINTLRQNLEADKKQLQKNQRSLDKLRLDREHQKIVLEEEKKAQETIIEKTQNSEFKFQELLAQVRSEKRKMEISLNEIENSLKEKLSKQNFDRFQTIDNIKFSWPIPYQGITTFFHDRTYPYKKLIGEHSGLDLRTLIKKKPTVGFPVRATADGTIIKIINNGSFVGNAVYIIHGINVMSAYYHLSRIDVVEDEYVKRGQVVGLSGGMPGAYGAGLSNGPHLHFELRINGIPADPLDYLPPAEFTPIDSIKQLKIK